ncbi:MAG: hypothetical protein ACYCOR_21060 [Acidobacteriaceae bacterium]
MAMSEGDRSLNPAADRRRMYVALAVLAMLGALSWMTIGSAAVFHVEGYSGSLFSYAGRDVEVRWFPISILGLFAFRVVMANMRARLEQRDSERKLM